MYTISMKKFELITFKNNNLQLDVNVSPNEETVWLSKEQIALLFDRDRTVISRHINNIYKEGELDEKSTCAKNAQVQIEGEREVTRKYEFYNLDVIISVGYRVKSKNGIIFRKWAINVLKEILIKGYCISDRAVISEENYLNLYNKVLSLDSEVSRLKKEIAYINPKSNIFYKGEYFESNIFVKNIVESVENELIIIDPYFNNKSLEIFKTKKNIKCILIKSSKSKIDNDTIEAFSKEYFPISFKINNDFHDRFLIVDSKTIFHIGTSLNYLGNKIFVITKIEDQSWCDNFIKGIKKDEQIK